MIGSRHCLCPHVAGTDPSATEKLVVKLPLIILSCAVMLTLSAGALAQSTDGSDPDAPIVAKFHHIRPYEITEGTPIAVGLETGDPGIGGMMIGIVSLNVYDRFGKVAI